MARRGPVTVAEFRATGGTGGGPDKTILFSAARHDPARVRILPCFLQQGGDDMAGIREFAEGAGVEPLFIPDRGPFDLALVGRMRRLLREHGCHILHAHDFKTDVLGEWIARGVPGVTPLATAHGWSRPLDAKHRLYHVLDRWALRRYPAVSAVSRDTATKLERAGVDPARVRVVPNGIDLETWTPAAGPAAPPPGLPPGARIVGTVGRLSIDKDMDTLITAFARVAPRVDDAVLALAGDGPERARLEALARASGAAERIFFLGHRGDLRGLYPALSVSFRWGMWRPWPRRWCRSWRIPSAGGVWPAGPASGWKPNSPLSRGCGGWNRSTKSWPKGPDRRGRPARHPARRAGRLESRSARKAVTAPRSAAVSATSQDRITYTPAMIAP